MWKNILRKRAGKGMSTIAKNLVDKVIDSKPRSVKEILELMWVEIENSNVNTTGRNIIPTRMELVMYLNKRYNSAKFSKITGRRVTKRADGVTRFWN